MQAKNGELAIARFDPVNEGERWEEHLCFVTGRDKSQTKFVYWDHKAKSTVMYSDSLPKGRVISAAPKPGKELLFLGGEFYKLTIDDVVPATQENMAALCLSVAVDTSKVKLGGCYHDGKAYCLGYRNGHDGEVELDAKLFTGLSKGVEGGAEAALRSHRENYDPSADIPRFIVELVAVRIIDEDTGNAGCDSCGTQDREDGQTECLDCLADDEDCECGSHPDDCSCDEESDMGEYCFDCGENDDDCLCHEDEGDCIRCGLDHTTCGCWDEDGYCNECQEICTDCECLATSGGCMADFDDENVDQTFRPMNAFARARWLRAGGQ